MKNYLVDSNYFCTFEGWIGGTCKPSDKGMLTAFPRFQNLSAKRKKIVSNMLKFEDLPEVNSPRWLSIEDLDEEKWRYVKGSQKLFMVSNYGRIKSLPKLRINGTGNYISRTTIRRESLNKKGYYICIIRIDKKRIGTDSVARMVAEAFIKNPFQKPQVDHKSGEKKDNRVCNLRWVTNLENSYNPITRKRRNKKILAAAEKRWNRKIHRSTCAKKVLQLTLDGKVIREWNSVSEARKVYGSQVSHCCLGHRRSTKGYRWEFKKNRENYATDETKNDVVMPIIPYVPRRGSANPCAKAIVQLTLDGEFVKEWGSVAEAQREYGFCVGNCCSGYKKSAYGYRWIHKESYTKLNKNE